MSKKEQLELLKSSLTCELQQEFEEVFNNFFSPDNPILEDLLKTQEIGEIKLQLLWEFTMCNSPILNNSTLKAQSFKSKRLSLNKDDNSIYHDLRLCREENKKSPIFKFLQGLTIDRLTVYLFKNLVNMLYSNKKKLSNVSFTTLSIAIGKDIFDYVRVINIKDLDNLKGRYTPPSLSSLPKAREKREIKNMWEYNIKEKTVKKEFLTFKLPELKKKALTFKLTEIKKQKRKGDYSDNFALHLGAFVLAFFKNTLIQQNSKRER